MDAIWDELNEDMLNPLVQQALDAGRVPLGCTCTFAPLPLMSVGKLFPLALRAPKVSTTELADVYLSSVICAYTRSLQEFQMQGSYYYFGGYVVPCACDHIRRYNDHLDLFRTDQDTYFNYCLDVPRKTGVNQINYYTDELKRFAAKLEEHFGFKITDEALKAEIVKFNEFNDLLRPISESRKADEPPISGTEFHKLMVGINSAPRDLLVEPVKKLSADLKKKKQGINGRARIMVMGGKLDNPDYIRAIESQGAVVVADRLCLGALPSALDPVKLEGDPYRNLAEHYLTKVHCARMMEKRDDRIAELIDLVREYRVDGVIIEVLKFCDIWNIDTITAIEALRKEGIPVMRLEREYRHTGEGQLITRTQAFLESIEGRRIASGSSAANLG